MKKLIFLLMFLLAAGFVVAVECISDDNCSLELDNVYCVNGSCVPCYYDGDDLVHNCWAYCDFGSCSGPIDCSENNQCDCVPMPPNSSEDCCESIGYNWIDDGCCGDGVCGATEKNENCPKDCPRIVPEFNALTLIAVLVVVAIAIMLIMKKKK